MQSTANLATTTPREDFRALAAMHRVVPVTRKVLADSETPLSAYRKLAANRPGTFLLESAENGRSWSRWSFIGAGAPSALTVRDGEAVWLGVTPRDAPSGGDPLQAIRETLELLKTEPLPGLPPLSSGLVGLFAYDMVRRLERLPELAVDDLGLPDMLLLLATDVAAVDHHEGTITLIANAVNWNGTDERVDWAYDDAVGRLDVMTAALSEHLPSTRIDIKSEEEKRREVEAQFEGLEAGAAPGDVKRLGTARPPPLKVNEVNDGTMKATTATKPAKPSPRARLQPMAMATPRRKAPVAAGRAPVHASRGRRENGAQARGSGADDARGDQEHVGRTTVRNFRHRRENRREDPRGGARGNARARRVKVGEGTSLSTVRIYKVAELLGTTSQEVTALLKRDHGIDVKSASSTIEEVVAPQFVQRLARQRNISLPGGDMFAETPVVKGKKSAPPKKAAEPVKPVAPALPPPRLVKAVRPAWPPWWRSPRRSPSRNRPCPSRRSGRARAAG